jgi:hypothetical protein
MKRTSLMRARGFNYCRLPLLAVFVSATNPGGNHEDTRLSSLQPPGRLVASIIDGSEYGTGCRTSIGHA